MSDLTTPVAVWVVPEPAPVAWLLPREPTPEERASILAGGPLPADMKPVAWDAISGRPVYEIRHTATPTPSP